MHVYDMIGVGLGPFNLSLACLSSSINDFNTLFFDRRESFDWHPGMMLEGAHLQTPFMSDLVTLADPTHPLSFLNYAKQVGKLYSFYIREDFFLLRQEYNQYCQWAAGQLDNLRFCHCVEAIHFDADSNCYQLTVNHQGTHKHYRARHVVLGTGPLPSLPPCCQDKADIGLHSSDYLYQKDHLQDHDSITVVGSGQSAAEIFYDLLQDIDHRGYELNWITRSARFSPLEYSKLTLEMTSPEYVDYFYSLPKTTRRKLLAEQRYLYKGINGELINAIFDLLYTKQLNGELRCNILTNTSLQSLQRQGEHLKLGLFQSEQQQHYQLSTQQLVLATGYQYRPPEFLTPLKEHIRWDEDGRFDVGRDYSINKRQGSQSGPRLFVQNAELHSHGFVTPDLGMACYRNSCILREVLGYEAYCVEEKIAFQQFSAKPIPAFLRDSEHIDQRRATQ